MVSNKDGDCFAYDGKFKKCRALNNLYCKNEVCEFYKTKEQLVKERKCLDEEGRLWCD